MKSLLPPQKINSDLASTLQEEVPTISDPVSGDLLYKRILLIDLSRMDKDRDKMAERILHLTLEILFRLTGQDYTVVKKTSSDRCQDPVSEGWGRPLSPITGPPPHPPIHEDINDQKILELTYKMIELLTGEVMCWDMLQKNREDACTQVQSARVLCTFEKDYIAEQSPNGVWSNFAASLVIGEGKRERSGTSPPYVKTFESLFKHY
ncbi:uncharacterized protein LOC142312917 [Anomaloglossus baeobatrachus]|uniref:uncharacterized protein LOC142312917 n=1 Tax=Anomaloglossus baeobatrachus TaxID=238106 RepID=UPI003F508C85